LAWCEANTVDYVFGLARNARLEGRIADALDESRLLSQANAGQPARLFRDFDWSTKENWSRRRRVISKAEWARGEANPRFLVTSFSADGLARQATLRKALLRARRDGEPHQGMPGRPVRRPHLDATMRANQLRLWFASMAYVLIFAPCAASRSPTRRWPTRPAARSA
jgi:Transposase DDE domain group 1